MRGIGGGCDEEACRLITHMPRWQPARMSGKPVNAYYTELINFRFPDNKYKPLPVSGIYWHVKEKPEPAYDLIKYLRKNVVYPDSAKSKGIHGKVIIQFVVNEDGSISDSRVIKGIGGGCDEQALNAIKNMPRWRPGKQNDKKVKVYATKSMTFGLTNE